MSASILDRDPPLADRRIRYGPEPLQFGDLRLPPGPGPHPCAIAIHGGFWRNRYDLAHLGHLCAALATAGIATWNVEYRRIGDMGGGWPGTLRDVALAARYLGAHASRYGIDQERIVAIGHSAGGHLASWLAAAGKVPEGSWNPVDPIPLRAVVSLAGVLDLRRAWELDLSGGAVEELLGGSPDEVPDRYAAASPIERVPAGVPHLLVHGEADDTVPIELSRRYRETALAVGDDARLIVLPGAGHFEPIDPRSAAWPTILAAIRDTMLEGRTDHVQFG